MKKDRVYWTWKNRTCPHCNKRFNKKEDLQKHIRAAHDAPLNQSSTVQYAQEQHIKDLKAELGIRTQSYRRALQAANDCIALLLERIN